MSSKGVACAHTHFPDCAYCDIDAFNILSAPTCAQLAHQPLRVVRALVVCHGLGSSDLPTWVKKQQASIAKTVVCLHEVNLATFRSLRCRHKLNNLHELCDHHELGDPQPEQTKSTCECMRA